MVIGVVIVGTTVGLVVWAVISGVERVSGLQIV